HEFEIIQEIVKGIFHKLSHTSLEIALYPVGLESRTKEMISLLCLGSPHVRMIGIHGIGGIGKTTIAKALYNEIASQFEGTAFLANVADVSSKFGLAYLQEQLLSKILLIDWNVGNVHMGATLISERLCFKKVLIVLDDVTQLCQLQVLAARHDWFGLGSRIIVTSRDKHLLAVHEVDDIYEVKKLSNDESLQLLSLNAFKRPFPPNDYVVPSIEVVAYVDGIPLALNVLGSFLYGRDKIEWKSALDRLKKHPNKKIFEALRISFDGLEETEKSIFLDIACFFHGEDEAYVKTVLDGCGLYAGIGLRILCDKSLLTTYQNKIWMHTMLQEMGREIVRLECPNDPGKRSRLWSYEEVYHVLKTETGTEAIEGIMLDFPAANDALFGTKVFADMKRLRLLKVKNANVLGRLDSLPKELRLLDWNEYQGDSISSVCLLRKLAVLKMCRSNIKQLWKGMKVLNNLKHLEFKFCQYLTKIPDATGLPNLEELQLLDCYSLVEVHQSIAQHSKLRKWEMIRCNTIKHLPSNVRLKSLQYLCFFCSKLIKFPEILGSMEALEGLYLNSTGIRELPASIELLTGLNYVYLYGCKNLTSLPDGISNLKAIRVLLLENCTKLRNLPENLGCMENLQVLLAGNTAIEQVPTSAVRLKKLQKLSLYGCGGKKPESSSMSLLSWLFPRKAMNSTTGLQMSFLSGLLSLRELDLRECYIEAGLIDCDLSRLLLLEKLDLSDSNIMSLPDSINQLVQLKHLLLENCRMLQELPELPTSLTVLRATDCVSLEQLSNLLTIYRSDKPQKFTFCNCLKLIEYMGDNIESTLFRSQVQGLSPNTGNGFGIFLPGSKIPMWFTYRSVETSISFQLPSQCLSRITGFAICVVASMKTINILDFITCSIKLDDRIIHELRMDFVTQKLKVHVLSDHVWLQCQARDRWSREYAAKSGRSNFEASFTSSRFSEEEETAWIRMCAVHPIFEKVKDDEANVQMLADAEGSKKPKRKQDGLCIHEEESSEIGSMFGERHSKRART
ncbi:NB-ARC, partial [Dillenia turbinata]